MKRPAGGPVLVVGVLTAAVLVTVATVAWLALRPAGPSTLAERTRAVASTLRCPVCQDLSVADSPSSVAGALRMAWYGARGQTAAELARALHRENAADPGEVTAPVPRGQGPAVFRAERQSRQCSSGAPRGRSWAPMSSTCRSRSRAPARST